MFLCYKLSITLTKQNQKIPDVTDFVVKKTNLTELENKIPDVSSLATKAALLLLKIKYLALVIQLKNTQ